MTSAEGTCKTTRHNTFSHGSDPKAKMAFDDGLLLAADGTIHSMAIALPRGGIEIGEGPNHKVVKGADGCASRGFATSRV